MSEAPIIIAGAGIGGLTTALSLHQIGVPVRIIEAVSEVKPLGVGINVLPHAVRELTELGLGDRVESAGIATAELAYFSKLGQLIWREDRGRAAGYTWPQVSIHRGRLQMLLYEAVLERLGPDAIATACSLTAFETVGDHIAVSITQRVSGATETIKAPLLIAADGIHSTGRACLYPDEGPPIWNGAILWRGTTEARPFLTGASMIMAGHEFQKFVCYPIADLGNGRQLINWIAERKFTPDHVWNREDWNRPGDLNDVLPWFEDWRFDWLDVPALIRAHDAVYEFPMVDRDPMPTWLSGRMALLGDAAHPMYPIGSNGASQAILDARHLARFILDQGATPDALAAYEAERRPATARIVAANRANGPEQVMQLVEERAPDGYAEISDVLTGNELEDTAATYKKTAGFDKDALNARPPIVPLPAVAAGG